MSAHSYVEATLRTAVGRSGSAPRQHRQQRAELDLRLGQLGLGVGVRNHADAGVAVRRAASSSAQRRATQNSPSSVASIHPTGPAYQPRSSSSSSRIVARRPATARRPRRRSDAARRQLDRAARLSQLGAHRACRGAGCSPPAPSTGSSAAATHTDSGSSERSIVRTTIRCSAGPCAVEQPLAEVVVDRRIGAAARRPRQRDRAQARALAAHQKLRARARRMRPSACRRRSRSSSDSRPAIRRRRRRRGTARAPSPGPHGRAPLSRGAPRIRAAARATASS